MKRKTILRITAAFLLSCTVLACGTACESSKDSEETEDIEETVTETTEAKTPETSAQPTETSAVVTETVAETEGAADTSADDDRFRAFFENQYPNLNESMMFDINGINVIYAYYDLDQDGINELLIGDVEGVYAVVSEAPEQRVASFHYHRRGDLRLRTLGRLCLLGRGLCLLRIHESRRNSRDSENHTLHFIFPFFFWATSFVAQFKNS